MFIIKTFLIKVMKKEKKYSSLSLGRSLKRWLALSKIGELFK